MKSAKFALLTTNEHLALKLNPINNYSFAKNNHLVSVVLHELPKMSANYPVVFVKNQDTGKFMPMALLGLEPNNNLFVSESGVWLPGTYIPAAFRRYPFALTRTDAETMALCIDMQSDCFSESEGISLFNAQGQASDIEITYKEISKLKKELYDILANHSGQTYEKIEADGDRDFWMTAEEAKAYGFIDEVLGRRK